MWFQTFPHPSGRQRTREIFSLWLVPGPVKLKPWLKPTELKWWTSSTRVYKDALNRKKLAQWNLAQITWENVLCNFMRYYAMQKIFPVFQFRFLINEMRSAATGTPNTFFSELYLRVWKWSWVIIRRIQQACLQLQSSPGIIKQGKTVVMSPYWEKTGRLYQ